ncbi:2-dehydro-3-deoxy-6-phosphogalactonate aldolase [Citrobacter rodentium]|uniref:2-dehydro-3-deoxy-6-phosphogalactonate aldolase n=2 Tax=Citrobacter rodentium TaxID=67825 RepID=D2TR50_CITRI|nr:2-dehydro-3-deoxy-6-phosphogalactonate aldolase [Citrobacter rodentium]KIQ50825.1 2-dehydro-3-deoxy-6-phosphogalactonate aldolase [Citrobacter rodentium]QBY31064.1 2-dehydro-3-deoxy-6-phosphogalactonate aldolase [Citrobacter rodentium]UHO31567.1 2-dehydro-3-deoxy-6-phosphogalactonate aldolase [Citrobacter rodentium NBRC 105723 = DSM 16636]CBG91530.1 2-dehydro-3-deoxy-6-phosphogalactonate aldolase [Citrobacter rodentium ICC168]HAT8013235.1 2-dehydro-3-deoxy-6-phosphogalactonate aldolase [Cit
MQDNKLVAILRGITPAEVDAHIDALLAAGFRYIEIPLNSPDWQESIPRAIARAGEKAMIGAGTVLRPEQVDSLAKMGAKLIVTPNIQPAVIRQAVSYGMVVCPGCATATEAFTALDAGAQWLKIFPSAAFGPAYIRALKAVLPPAIPVLAVGGVTPDNLADYLAAGCAGAGTGSDLYQPGQSVARTQAQAARFMAAWRAAH